MLELGVHYSVSFRGHVVKCCNHLLAVNMAGVACRGLWCAWLERCQIRKVLWCYSYLVWLLSGGGGGGGRSMVALLLGIFIYS